MKRFAIGKAGIVQNIIGADDASQINEPGFDVFEDTAESMNAGDTYDATKFTFNKVDPISLKIILSLQNEIRALQSKPALADVEALKVELKKTVTADAVAAEAVIKP